MKKILLLLFVILSTTVFSQNKDKTILGCFVLGVDSFPNTLNNINISEYDVYEAVDYVGNLKKVVVNNFRYKGSDCRLILLFINNKLYGVRYYPSPFNFTYNLRELKQQYNNGEIIDNEYYREYMYLSKKMNRYDNRLRSYVKYLDTHFNKMQIMGSCNSIGKYFNSHITIEFDIDGNYDESFIHYSTELMGKYPQFKNF